MIDIQTFTDIMDDLACELPEQFFDELNLGISVSSEAKRHPQSRGDELYIMGEYFRNVMGRGIVIYYGSFCRIHGDLSLDRLKDEMRRTLRHEFRHHLEGLAQEDGLEREDARQLRDYLDRQ